MKNKGFTIVELLLSLGISSIVTGLILTFFITGYRTYKTVRNDSEMGFHAQYILNFMAGRIIDSNSISFAKLNTQNYGMTAVRSGGTEYQVTNVSFKYGNDAAENYVFAIINNNIKYGDGEKDKTATVELGNYVDKMYVSLLKNESFQDARAVKIKIVMKKDSQTYDAFQTVYMRN